MNSPQDSLAILRAESSGNKQEEWVNENLALQSIFVHTCM
jgi:hypothetical protein